MEKLYKTKYNGYLATRNGHIFSEKTNKFLVGKKDKDGYIEYCLSLNGKQKYVRGHRIIAETFIPNPENKPTINHKNGIKDDNSCFNLEWATYSENNYHRLNVLGHKLDTAQKFLINDKEIISKSELKKRTSKQFIESIEKSIKPLKYTVFIDNKNNTFSAVFNKKIIKIFNTNEEAANYYSLKKNTISYHRHKKLSKTQLFSLNNKVQRLTD